MNAKPILVQMSAYSWTMQAVHLACALARSNQAEIRLLRMIPVTHPSYLGTAYGLESLSCKERKVINEYVATAEDYQVQMSLQPVQYVTALDAVAYAAELFDAGIVFAHVPKSIIPYWQRFQIWRLERRFAAQQRKLFTLTNGKAGEDQVPFIIDAPARSSASQRF